MKVFLFFASGAVANAADRTTFPGLRTGRARIHIKINNLRRAITPRMILVGSPKDKKNTDLFTFYIAPIINKEKHGSGPKCE